MHMPMQNEYIFFVFEFYTFDQRVTSLRIRQVWVKFWLCHLILPDFGQTILIYIA